jgi:hypothetical protein
MRTVSAWSCLVSALVAQVPTDSCLVLEVPAGAMGLAYRVVDVAGLGQTPLRGQSVFLQPGPTSVAVDPSQPSQFFFQAATTSLPGTWRSEVGALATLGQSTWGPWLQAAADRVDVGATRVVTLRGGVVESCQRTATAPQPPVILFQLPNASDLAVREPFVYVASLDVANPSPLVEFDLNTGAQRVVGSYQGVRSIALSPGGGELLLGTTNGDLTTVSVATGAVLQTGNPQLGPIVAVGYSRFGTRLYATATELWSDLYLSGPIHVSTTAIVDFGVATTPVASVTPFGQGCGLGASLRWANAGLPTLGNSVFRLGVRQAPPATVVLLVLGDSRGAAAQLGVLLPFDLAPFGAAGCLLLADPQAIVPLLTNGQGAVDQSIPIPPTASLAGAEYAAQWFLADASVGSFGLAGSEGVAFRLQ